MKSLLLTLVFSTQAFAALSSVESTARSDKAPTVVGWEDHFLLRCRQRLLQDTRISIANSECQRLLEEEKERRKALIGQANPTVTETQQAQLEPADAGQ